MRLAIVKRLQLMERNNEHTRVTTSILSLWPSNFMCSFFGAVHTQLYCAATKGLVHAHRCFTPAVWHQHIARVNLTPVIATGGC